MPHDDKTEQATPRRKQKAREKGQVARSRELPAALAGFAALMVVLWTAGGALNDWRIVLRQWTDLAWGSDFGLASPLPSHAARLALRWSLPPLAVAWTVAVGMSLAQGGFVFAGEALLPKFERLSPASRLGQMFSVAGLSAPAKSLIPFSILLYLGTSVLLRDWELLARAATLPRIAMADLLYRDAFEIAWKSTLTLLLWAAIDYLLQRRKLEGDLRMSKQEIREEYKETDGHPSIKARIRRLQRQLRRRRVLQEVERASVVVTNPTHFAVALEYRPEMAAPIVVAKGCNQLAEKMKRVAYWHEIPVLENKPLAQALYRNVEVGQAIPAKLYVAVAELLAYLYRAQMRAQQATSRGRG
jgi:flagellar biosynthesis protein FlhB